MNERRLLEISDRLPSKGYRLLAFSDDRDLYEGHCGCYIRAMREDCDAEYLVFIARKSFDFEALAELQYGPEVASAQIYALERDYVVYHWMESEQVATLDQIIYRAVTQSPRLFAYLNLQAARTKKLAWVTDIHLNFLVSEQRDKFIRTIAAHEPDLLLISGDIGEANDFGEYLQEIETGLQKPIYFILGNHDFYRSSWNEVRKQTQRLANDSRYLSWLTGLGVVRINQNTALIGHEGWADARYGDFDRSIIMMNDHLYIRDFLGLNQAALKYRLQKMGDTIAAELTQVLQKALRDYRHVILLTHVPPVDLACRHDGRIADANWLPHFSCRALGDALLAVMGAHPDQQLTVLCGHTHSMSLVKMSDNITVLTGEAEYGAPIVQEIFQIPE